VAHQADRSARQHKVSQTTTRSIANGLASVATALAVVAAGAGLLIPGLYRDAPYWVQQARGTDLATLLVAVPVIVLGMRAARRGSGAGQLAVFAGLLYVVYNYGIFVFSVVMNPLTAVHIAIVGLALWSLVLTTRSPALSAAGAAAAEGLNRRASGVLLVAVAGLFGLLWIGQIATTTTTGVLAPDLVRAGLSTNPVYALDLAFFLPLCALAGLGLLRRNVAGAFGQPMLIWVALMGDQPEPTESSTPRRRWPASPASNTSGPVLAPGGEIGYWRRASPSSRWRASDSSSAAVTARWGRSKSSSATLCRSSSSCCRRGRRRPLFRCSPEHPPPGSLPSSCGRRAALGSNRRARVLRSTNHDGAGWSTDNAAR
jgi:hypothetical protein